MERRSSSSAAGRMLIRSKALPTTVQGSCVGSDMVSDVLIFHHACASGRADTVEQIVQRADEAHLNKLRESTTQEGDSAVHVACMNGSSSVLAVLLKYGFSLTLRNAKGERPMDVFLQSPVLERSEAVMAIFLGQDPALLFARGKRKVPVEVLVESGSETILAFAVRYLRTLACKWYALDGHTLRSRSKSPRPRGRSREGEELTDEEEEENAKLRAARAQLFQIEFNSLSATVKKCLLEKDVPIGWLFAIGSSAVSLFEEDVAPNSPHQSPKGHLNRSRSPRRSRPHLADVSQSFDRIRGKTRKEDGSVVLNVRGAGLSLLPASSQFWRSLAHVTEIDARDNRLCYVPCGCLDVPNLRAMHLLGNPMSLLADESAAIRSAMTGSSREASKKLWAATKTTLTGMRKAAAKFDLNKLMMVGPQGCSKADLFFSLIGLEDTKYDEKEPMIIQGAVLAGAKKRRKTLPKGEARRVLRYCVIDLGDNEPLKCTQRIFLSQSMIYIVAVDALKAKQQLHDMDYYMAQIKDHSAGLKVQHHIVIVGITKTAEDGAKCTKEYWGGIEDLLKNRYPSGMYRGFDRVFTVNLATKTGLPDVRTYLDALAQEDQDERQTETLVEWQQVHEAVLKTRETKLYSTWKEFQELVSVFGICRDTEQTEVAKFLQRIGTITYFVENPDTLAFDDTVLLIFDPLTWATKLLSFAFISRLTGGGRSKRAAYVNRELLFDVLQLENEPSAHRILEFLETVGFAYVVGEEEVFVPSNLQLASTKVRLMTTQSIVWDPAVGSDTVEHRRVYSFASIPVNIIDRLMVMASHMPSIVPRTYHTGMILVDLASSMDSCDLQTARLQYKRTSGGGYQLEIATRMPADYFDLVFCKIPCTETVPLLMVELVYLVEMLVANYYPSLLSTLVRSIPCSHCVLSTKYASDPFEFSFDDVVGNILDGTKTVFCRGIQSKSRTLRLARLAPDLTLQNVRKVPRSKLEYGRELGKGAFGTVHLAHYKSSEVAVKELSFAGMDFVSEELRREKQVAVFVEFQKEVFLMSVMVWYARLTRSRNMANTFIVNLLGIEADSLKMVLEYVPHGTLHELIRAPSKEPPPAPPFRSTASQLSWAYRRKVALDVARAMEYLSSHDPPIVHRDLRSPNIFLVSLDESAPVVAKVADFGLSTMAPANKAAGMLHSWRWLAPEVIDHVGTRQYSWRSDVYSFGVVLWELCCGEYPFGEYREADGWEEWELKQAIIKQHVRPTIGSDFPRDLAKIIKECWAPDPRDRPSFAEIASRLCGTEKATEVVTEPARRLISSHTPVRTLRMDAEGKGGKPLLTAGVATSIAVEVTVMEMHLDRLFVGGTDGTVGVYDVQEDDSGISFAFVHSWRAHSKKVTGIVVTPFVDETGASEQYLIWTSSTDGGVRIWLSDTFELHLSYSLDIAAMCRRFLLNGAVEVWMASVASRNILVYRACSVSEVEQHKKIELLVSKGGHRPIPGSVVFFGRDLALVGAEQAIYVLNVKEYSVVCYFPAHERSFLRGLHKVAGKQEVWSFFIRNSGINCWKVQDMGLAVELVQEIKLHHSKVTAVTSAAFPGQTAGDPKRTLVFSSSADNNILVWDDELQKAVEEIELDSSKKEIATSMLFFGNYLIAGISVSSKGSSGDVRSEVSGPSGSLRSFYVH